MAKKRGRPRGKRRAAPVSLRLPDDLRARLLEATRERNDSNLSREIIERLWASFGPHNEKSMGKIRPIAWLANELLKSMPGDGDFDAEPWRFEAFRSGVNTILEEFRPPGEIQPPKNPPFTLAGDLERYPADLGRLVARVIMDLLRKTPPPRPGAGRLTPRAWDYSFPQVRKDLGLDEPEQGRVMKGKTGNPENSK